MTITICDVAPRDGLQLLDDLHRAHLRRGHQRAGWKRRGKQVEGILEGRLDSGERLQVLSCEPGGGEGANRWYQVQTQGANGRDLRALVERQGGVVSRVLRVQFGPLQLDRGLPRGQVRALEESDPEALMAAGEQPPPEPATESAAGD